MKEINFYNLFLSTPYDECPELAIHMIKFAAFYLMGRYGNDEALNAISLAVNDCSSQAKEYETSSIK